VVGEGAVGGAGGQGEWGSARQGQRQQRVGVRRGKGSSECPPAAVLVLVVRLGSFVWSRPPSSLSFNISAPELMENAHIYTRRKQCCVVLKQRCCGGEALHSSGGKKADAPVSLWQGDHARGWR